MLSWDPESTSGVQLGTLHLSSMQAVQIGLLGKVTRYRKQTVRARRYPPLGS